MISKPPNTIVKEDIEDLLRNQVRESRTIDYKLVLPGRTDADVKEFLADVSSFANTVGGDIYYGIQENEGVPTRADGLKGDIDAEKLRLESILRTGLDPRIPGVILQPIEGFSHGPILLIRVPQSWSAPHMVTYKDQSRFYARNSAGKYQLDVLELRASFLLSESVEKKIRLFRDDRVARIAAGDTPVLLREGANLILHLIPLSAFSTAKKIDIGTILGQWGELSPIGSRGSSYRLNFNGLATFTSQGQPSSSYCQIFRQGQIEAVYTRMVDKAQPDNGQGKCYIQALAYEQLVIAAIKKYLAALQTLDVTCPIYVILTLTGVKNCFMAIPNHLFFDTDRECSIDMDILLLPDVTLLDYNADIPLILRPAFDTVWNACGHLRSLNYDTQGKWAPRT